jgi:hypothetical protein
MRPGLKLLTPLEELLVAKERKRVAQMWKSLYAKNKWTPQPDEKKTK